MELIKKLRDLTGAGIVDCQNALKESNNDLEKAIEYLRKKGIAKAAKREGREAGQGVVEMSINAAATEGYMIELNAETDFVAKNEKFKNLAKEILAVVEKSKPADLDSLLSAELGKGTVKDAVDSLSGVIGEKMILRRLAIVSGATVAAYSHAGGKIGVLIALDKPQISDLAVDIAMQIAASDPKYLEPSEVPAAEIAKEKEIEAEKLAKENKPANVIEKILEGKLNKFYSEVCLVKQEYIKDDKKKVEQVLNGAKILKFVRFSLQDK